MEITPINFDLYHKNSEASKDIADLKSEIDTDGDQSVQNMQQNEAKREQEENS